ncbi:MAG: hypothetical protein E6P95_03955 [Candidatus Moraniibacteriota bacterium]|nr:MAG: hypothetical protein E6P95_03955 [Candidatus Moranbacteria bacterium]
MELNSAKMLEVAERVIYAAIRLTRAAGIKEKDGGYLAIFEISRGNLEVLAAAGYSPQEKIEGRQRVSQEKCIRILANGHNTSYESRNPAAGLWGGAVRGTDFIFSFSGLPELWDEAAMFVLAIRLRQLREYDVLAQISEERNPHLRPLLEACHWTE